MRLISKEEVQQVSGGGLWDEAMAAIQNFFQGSSTMQCTPGTNTANGVTTSQLCGGPSSTVTISGPGYQVIMTSMAGTNGAGTLFGPGFGVNGSATGGGTLTTTTIIGGVATTTVSR